MDNSSVVFGEKIVFGVPWRYGDPAAFFEFGRELGVGSRAKVVEATKRAATTTMASNPSSATTSTSTSTAKSLGAPPGLPLACKVLEKEHERFSMVDVRREVEAAALASEARLVVPAAAAAAVASTFSSSLMTTATTAEAAKQQQQQQQIPIAAKIYEVWEDDHAVYLFSRACLGGELHARVAAQGRLAEPDAAAAATAVLALLAHLHAAGWVHRDVKLENFLYSGGGAGGGAGAGAGGGESEKLLASGSSNSNEEDEDGKAPPTSTSSTSPLSPTAAAAAEAAAGAAAAAAAHASPRGALLGVDFGSAVRLPLVDGEGSKKNDDDDDGDDKGDGDGENDDEKANNKRYALLSGPPVGSAPYVAPEQIGPGGYGTPADMWSAGCLLYALLVGNLPFGGKKNNANGSGNNDNNNNNDADGGGDDNDGEDQATLAAIADAAALAKRGKRRSVLLTSKCPLWARVSAPARDLVLSLLAPEPGARPTAAEALKHPWLLAGGDCGADGKAMPLAPREARADAAAAAREAARDAALMAAAEAAGRVAGAARRVLGGGGGGGSGIGIISRSSSAIPGSASSDGTTTTTTRPPLMTRVRAALADRAERARQARIARAAAMAKNLEDEELKRG